MILDFSDIQFVAKTVVIQHDIHKRKRPVLPGYTDIIVPGAVLGVLLVKTNQLHARVQRQSALDAVQVDGSVGSGLSDAPEIIAVDTARQRKVRRGGALQGQVGGEQASVEVAAPIKLPRQVDNFGGVSAEPDLLAEILVVAFRNKYAQRRSARARRSRP